MKITSIILLGLIAFHQTQLPVLNSLLLLELGLLALFYFVGGRYIKDYFRSKRRRDYLRGVSAKYKSKSDGKVWRSRTQTEVSRNSFIDTL